MKSLLCISLTLFHIEKRAFPMWISRAISMAKSDPPPADEAEVLRIGSDTHINLLEIGKRLSSLPEVWL